MAISFTAAVGHHPELLNLQVERVATYGSNLVNSETTNYRASDFDIVFREQVLSLETTNNRHLSTGSGMRGERTARPQLQTMLRNNSVDVPLEQATLARTLADYSVNVSFLRHRLMTMSSAIAGR